MSTVVVRYLAKPDQADENQRLVEAVFAELAAKAPDGLSYATFRLADGTFIHIAEVEGGTNPLTELTAFRDFVADVEGRCEAGEGPNPQPATLVGSYRFSNCAP
jgi:hypothetical protein